MFHTLRHWKLPLLHYTNLNFAFSTSRGWLRCFDTFNFPGKICPFFFTSKSEIKLSTLNRLGSTCNFFLSMLGFISNNLEIKVKRFPTQQQHEFLYITTCFLAVSIVLNEFICTKFQISSNPQVIPCIFVSLGLQWSWHVQKPPIVAMHAGTPMIVYRNKISYRTDRRLGVHIPL